MMICKNLNTYFADFDSYRNYSTAIQEEEIDDKTTNKADLELCLSMANKNNRGKTASHSMVQY